MAQTGYFYIGFRVSDATGIANIYKLPIPRTFYISGDVLGDSVNTCYMPVFESRENDNIVHMGNFFISYFYLVFDQSPSTEFGADHIQIGIAPRNPTPIVAQDDKNDTSGAATDDPIPKPPAPPEPTPPTPVDPVDPVDPDKPVDPKPTPVDPVVPIPQVDPDNEDKRDWLEKNSVWIIIVSIILVVLLAACIYSIWKKRQDPYYAKHYSILSEGPINLN